MTWVPARGVVMVKKVETETQTAGGIHLPPTAIDRWTAQQAEVVAVGAPTVYDEEAMPPKWYHQRDQLKTITKNRKTYFYKDLPASLKPGAWVIVAPRILLPFGDFKHFLVPQNAILGVIEE